MNRRALLGGALAAPALLSIPVRAQGVITLNGASQFGDDHPYTKAMVKFEELVKQYWGKPINFVLHKNSSLGPHSSPHFALASFGMNTPAFDTASAKFCISGASLCSGMLGMRS